MATPGQGPAPVLHNPSAKDITNLYLYGTVTTPHNLVDSKLIRPGNTQTDITVDVNDFMQNGAGRFATGGNFPLVQKFFSSNGPQLPPGTYDKQQVAQAHGMGGYFGLNMQQYDYRDGKDDYAARTYVYNSMEFKIDDKARFVVGKDGKKHIENFAIVPRGADNFDFESNDRVAQLGNSFYLQPRIDPSNIGRKVNINFSSNINRRNYSEHDFATDSQRVKNWQGQDLTKLVGDTDKLVEGLWTSGTTKFLDQAGRPIIYSTNSSHSPSAWDIMLDPINYPTLYKHAAQDGIMSVSEDRIQRKTLVPEIRLNRGLYNPIMGRDHFPFGTSGSPAPALISTTPSAGHDGQDKQGPPGRRPALQQRQVP